MKANAVVHLNVRSPTAQQIKSMLKRLHLIHHTNTSALTFWLILIKMSKH